MLGRFPLQRLTVPGVIGVVSFYGLHYAQLGPDAGWPVPQAMLDWKTDFFFVERRMLTLEARALLGEKLPDEELAQALALNADMESVEAPPLYDEAALAELRLANSARLLLVRPELHLALRKQGVPVYRAGYSRVTSYLYVELPEGKATTCLWIQDPDPLFLYRPDTPAPEVSDQRLVELGRALWIDRALRALTHGVLSESAVHAARSCELHFWNKMRLVRDGSVQAAVEAVSRMKAGDRIVALPLHGRAFRVRLPPFEIRCDDADPFAQPYRPGHRRTLTVPAEDGWFVAGE